LLESKDPQGKDWDIVVIEAGLGKNDHFYSPQVLDKATSLYEHVPVYLFKLGGLADHLPDALTDQKKRLVGNQVGWLEDPHFTSFKADGKSKQGILARLHIDDGFKNLRAKLLDAWNHGLKTLYGLSHDARGDTTKDDTTGIETVDEIKEVSSVELVTYPAQGGQFIRLLASQGGTTMKFPKLRQALLGILTKLEPTLVEGLDESNITNDQFLEMVDALHEKDEFYTEAQTLEAKGPFMQSVIAKLITLLKGDKKEQALKVLTQLQTKLKDYTYPAPAKAKDSDSDKTKDSGVLTLEDLFGGADVDESAYTECMKTQMKAGKSMADAAKICKVKAKKPEPADKDKDKDDQVKDALARVAKVEENIKKTASATILDQVLKASDLFEPVKEKIRNQYKDRIFEKKDLEESLKQEKATLAKLTESGNLTGLGQSRVEVTLAESDKHQIAMDLLFENEVKDPKGVTAYRGIKEAYKSYNPQDPDVTFQSRRPKRLSEATMVVADFDNALGTSMMKKMLKVYKLMDLPWKEFVNIVPVSDFKQQERIRWGGFGELPTYDTEDAEYADIAFPTDEKATYTPLTKGGLFPISRRSIKNDDMNMLRQVPRRLARAAARTLNSFVWAFLINNSTIYDNAALFTAARGNLGASALDFDTLSVAVTALKGMREKGNYAVEGTVTGVSASTLETGKTWTASQYDDYYVRIVYGTGVGQYRKIASHTTGGVITLDADWTTNPDTSSKYEIFQHLDEKIGLKPAHIAVPSELEPTLDVILQSKLEPGTVENNINVMKNVAKKMVPPNLVDVNDWYVIADKTWLDLFELGFIDGAQNPTILIQDQPNVGTMFTRDRITYKIRHEYGGAPVDYRGFYKAVVS